MCDDMQPLQQLCTLVTQLMADVEIQFPETCNVMFTKQAGLWCLKVPNVQENCLFIVIWQKIPVLNDVLEV